MYNMLNTMLVISLIRILICIGIGISVYKDSQRNGLDPWLWTLLVIMLPSFIGVLIYLIIRNKHARNWQCSRCGGKVLEDYNLCPNCKAIFQRTCKHCGKAIVQETSTCPYCGENIHEEISETIACKQKQSLKINKTLGIISLVYIASIIIGIISTIYVPYYKSQKMHMQILQDMQNLHIEESEQYTNPNRIYYEKFKGKAGTISKCVDLVEGKNLGIKGHVSLQKGTVQIDIQDKHGEVLYTEIFKSGEQDIKITSAALGTGELEIIITFDKAKGEINLDTM